MSRTSESVTFDVVAMIPKLLRVWGGGRVMQVQKPTVRCVAGRLFMRASVVGTWGGREGKVNKLDMGARCDSSLFPDAARVLRGDDEIGGRGFNGVGAGETPGRISTPAGSEIDDSFPFGCVQGGEGGLTDYCR